jgi:50S ribosomal protein L16 3-hydroxylase
VRVLSDFAAKQTWTLSAGDMLYLPPRWAHHGVSLDEVKHTYTVQYIFPDTLYVFSRQRHARWSALWLDLCIAVMLGL